MACAARRAWFSAACRAWPWSSAAAMTSSGLLGGVGAQRLVVAVVPGLGAEVHVRADRWIGYPRATAALAQLETLLAWPAKQRMPNWTRRGRQHASAHTDRHD